MTAVSAASLRALAPTARADLVAAVADHWPEAEAAGITTPRRVRHFFARILVETGGLRSIEESLTYTTAERIGAVWPSRFKTVASAEPYVRQPQKLAIKVYGGRMGNAPAPSSDGWDFRGGGMMQTTGREGYRKMGFEDRPDALREPVTAFRTAIREWVARGCNAMADRDDVVAVCKAINGGTNGLVEQRSWLARAVKVFPDAPLEPVAPPLRRGSTGNAVRVLQRNLKLAGFYRAAVDGDFGGKTEASVKAFQRSAGLAADGIVGQITLSALNKET